MWILVLILIIYLTWRYTLKPSNQGPWRPDQAQLPQVIFAGDLVTIKNVRHCTYRGLKDFDVRYYDRTFKISDLKKADFIYQPFSSQALAAHTFISFAFGDEYITISIEARRRKLGAINMVKGMLRYYNLIYIVANEQDMMALRPLHQKDKVYIYPLNAKESKIQELFKDMAKTINELYDNPKFYNSFTNNCTTALMPHINHIWPLKVPRSWRIFFSGYIDTLLHKHGLFKIGKTLKDAKENYCINDLATQHMNDPDISQKIRAKIKY
jgi:hypothetical protein